jgi:hypothetical protein
MSSLSRSQILQKPETFIPRRFLLSSVASAFCAAFQAKTFTLGGTEAFHILDQQTSVPSALELDVGNERCSGVSFKPNWYALRTVNLPFFSGCQATTSSENRLEVLIFSMQAASTGRKI